MDHRNSEGGAHVALQGMALAVVLSIAGCGGGGGGGGDAAAPTSGAVAPTAQGSASLAGLCAAPRTGIDPGTGRAFADRAGTVADEKNWVRSWIDQTYLWYDEVPANLLATSYTTPVAYFNVLKTPVLTASGRAKDRFHFSYPTATYGDVQQGTEVGYGVEFAFLQRTAPRTIRVAYTEPNSPASQAGIVRGDTLLAIDGVDASTASSQAEVDRLNSALAPATNGQSHAFKLRAKDGSERTVTLVSAGIERSPVQNVRTLDTPGGRVGYLQFNDHVAKSEAQLVTAMGQLSAAGVTDLVLDMRYNGGGLLGIASEVASMIATPQASQGAVFEKLQFNRKNPFGLSPAGSSVLFPSTTRGYSVTAGQPLPRLGLSRVSVLAGPDTCSASESVVNGLRGIGVTVDLIGAATCGKPYGFYPQDNCGTTYFAIQFQGVNAKGFGDYGDGMAPTCTVSDDFEHALGDPAEGRFAAALSYRASGACPVPAQASAARRSAVAAPLPETTGTPYLDRNVLRSNRIVESMDQP
ncbi:S41 family peptidase [Variovorax boronicumulans]|uniref:S41 family peptidase n=1 Tax=Variovorax boronicumulans TaxID=436515 RepID=UPI001C563A92